MQTKRRGVESENEEISEIARNRKTNIIKRKIRRKERNSKKKQKTLWQTRLNKKKKTKNV